MREYTYMKLFFSWQSDLLEQKKFIRKNLQKICKELDIEYDEDSRSSGGAGYITDIILKKIRNSAVFVADITIVGETKLGKKLSNPNVCYELGYAEQVLSKEGVVLTFDESITGFNDLPFDLDKRNSARFEIGDETYYKRLKFMVEHALENYKTNLSNSEKKDDFVELSKYEKTLVYWAYKMNKNVVIVDKPYSREIGLLDTYSLFESEVNWLFCSSFDDKESSRFHNAIVKLVQKDLLILEERNKSTSFLTHDPNDVKKWVLSDTAEIIAEGITESEVFEIKEVVDDKKSKKGS
jgi:hypothetical protein